MSFRTRIFAISILTVSAVLAVIITLGWSRIMRVELDHLDARLCMEAKRMVPRQDSVQPQPRAINHNVAEGSGGRIISDLVDKLRISSAEQLLILVKSDQNGVVLRSNNGEADLIDRLIWSSEEILPPGFSHDPTMPPDANRYVQGCKLASFDHQQGEWRASLYSVPNGQSLIAVDIAATSSELRSTLRTALIVVIPFSLLLSALGAWFISSITIRPLNRLQGAMGMVTQKDLGHRLPSHKEDKEFKVLIDAYNTMLDRLEESFQQTSRFTADAAHELKTPLTILRGKLEQAVINENSSRIDLNDILDEVGNLSAITRKLLLLSQADSGSMALHLVPISITYLLDELMADMELLSDEVILHCDIQRNLVVSGDSVLLGQLFNNLLSNAIRYSRHEQGVTITACRSEAFVEVFISNHCCPIPQAVRHQLFDRFYRGEPEHIQGISGSGLGLSLAREIARAHGGDLLLEPSPDDIVAFKLRLPVAP